MSRTIQFTVTSAKKKEIDEYAETKGFGRAGSLARLALYQYMAKNPIKHSSVKKSEVKPLKAKRIRKRIKTSSLYSLKRIRPKLKRV